MFSPNRVFKSSLLPFASFTPTLQSLILSVRSDSIHSVVIECLMACVSTVYLCQISYLVAFKISSSVLKWIYPQPGAENRWLALHLHADVPPIYPNNCSTFRATSLSNPWFWPSGRPGGEGARKFWWEHQTRCSCRQLSSSIRYQGLRSRSGGTMRRLWVGWNDDREQHRIAV